MTLPSDAAFARSFSDALGIACTEARVRRFPDGELEVQWHPGAMPHTAVVVASLAATQTDSLHDRLMQLVFGIHQLKTAGVERCIGVVPYLGYARSDTKTAPTDMVGLQIVMRHLHYAGMDALLTVDVHTPAALHNAFTGSAWSVNAVPPMAKALYAHLPAQVPLSVCAPDVGAWKRARAWAGALSTPARGAVELAMVHKQRIRPDAVTHDAFTGDVEGRTVVVVDDMISTGGTMAQAVRTCYEHGAHAVWAAATHGLLVDPAPVRLAEVGVKGVLIADTIPDDRTVNTPLAERLHVVDVAPTCAEELSAVLPTGEL
ncbi:ribose-phosphate diphosphokinase [Longimonas halophila]|nr:ribose-phosphate diphosphokinase [Longimonas halophila]